MDSRIQDRQVANLFNAALYAEAIRREFSLALTITWRRRYPRASDVEMFKHHQHFMESIQHWLRYRGLAPVALWAFERDARAGLHSHVAVAVPNDLVPAFKVHCDKQFRSDTGETLPGIPHFKKLAKTSDRLRWTAYCLKGVDNHKSFWGPAFEGISIKRSGQGNIKFKRCGVTRSIDRAARVKAGFVDLPVGDELAAFVEDVVNHGVCPDDSFVDAYQPAAACPFPGMDGIPTVAMKGSTMEAPL